MNESVLPQLFILDNKKSLNEITNQDKLQIAKDFYLNHASKNANQYETIDQMNFENSFKQSVFGDLEFTHGDIFLASRLVYTSEVAYTYNKDTKSYTPNQVGHGIIYPNIAYTKNISLTEKDNTITLSNQYVFKKGTGDGPTDETLYSTYADCVNSVNPIKMIAIGELTSQEHQNEITKYIEDNYEKIKNNLKTYNYVFKYENKELKIIDFYLS